mmetsp:Transcript_45675/g.127095  ORF Transcript_45675/g.127095 Transcript_45675/m.127095 type:complete len:202 (+) Transcript_45675:409-1014(+)
MLTPSTLMTPVFPSCMEEPNNASSTQDARRSTARWAFSTPPPLAVTSAPLFVTPSLHPSPATTSLTSQECSSSRTASHMSTTASGTDTLFPSFLGTKPANILSIFSQFAICAVYCFACFWQAAMVARTKLIAEWPSCLTASIFGNCSLPPQPMEPETCLASTRGSAPAARQVLNSRHTGAFSSPFSLRRMPSLTIAMSGVP